MKKLLLAISIAFAITAPAQNPMPLLKGSLPQNARGYIYLTYPDSSLRWRLDSALIENGRFTFPLPIAAPVLARLLYKDKEEKLFIEPAEIQVLANEDLSGMKVTGSASNEVFELLNQPLRRLRERWMATMDSLVAIGRRNKTLFQEIKDWVMKPYNEQVNEIYLDFFRAQPYSIVTAQALLVSERELPDDTVQLVYNRLPMGVKASFYGQQLQKMIAVRSQAAVNTPAPLFSRNDVDGKPISLTDYRGRYVLIDFWGSWCIPCRRNNPHLKEIYRRYQSKGLEIIGIAADDNTPDAWRKAIADDGLPWRHILQGNKPLEDIGKQYNVRSYPTKLLLDKNGIIIGRFGSETDALDKLLEKVFDGGYQQ